MSVYDELIAGSELHRAKRNNGSVSIMPTDNSHEALECFQTIALMAIDHEGEGLVAAIYLFDSPVSDVPLRVEVQVEYIIFISGRRGIRHGPRVLLGHSEACAQPRRNQGGLRSRCRWRPYILRRWISSGPSGEA